MSHSTEDETGKHDVPVSTVPLWIDNQPHKSNVTFPVINHEKDLVVHQAYGATPELARKAVESAAVAFPAWRDAKPWRRRTLFLKAAGYLEERRNEVAEMARVRLH
jgi:malonate-semialdehyde dehydrogenase (acetylating) / methylmalonate-semialdehyde dehydrogenase